MAKPAGLRLALVLLPRHGCRNDDRRSEELALSETSAAPARDTQRRERLLVVEDDPVTRAMIAGYFADHGYEVAEAGSCAECRQAHHDALRARGMAAAQKRLPVEMREQLLNVLYDGQPFRQVPRDLGLTSNQVWGCQDRQGPQPLKPP